MTSLHENYRKFRVLIDKNIPLEELNGIKSIFESQIGSNRRYDNIKTVSQLFDVLEKRDILNEANVEVIKDIAIQLKLRNILQVIESYNASIHESTVTIERPPETAAQQIRVLPDVPLKVEDRVFKLISSDVGSKWKDFGRALKIKEGYLDELEIVHKNNVSERIYEILRYHEKDCDTRAWRTEIVTALQVARRNDLVKEVHRILDTHNYPTL